MKYLKVREGHWKNWKDKDIYNWAMHAPEKQISFMRELCRTHGLGHSPSMHYPVRIKFPHKIPKQTAKYILRHSSHSRSHFTEALSQDKSASGIASTIGKWVSKAGEYIPTWVKDSARIVAKNLPTISKYAAIAGGVAQVVAPVGESLGLWSSGTAENVTAISEALSKARDALNPKKKTAKKAGGFTI